MYGHNYKKTFHSIKDFQAEIFSGKFKNKYIFCHFAEFDLNVIFGNIKKNLDNESIFNGSTFIMAQKEKVLFADSLNIYKTSAQKIGEMMGLHKLERPQKFGLGKKFDITTEDIDYCYRDCEIIYKALSKIFLEVQSVRPTLASLSMIYFRRFYQDYHIAYNQHGNKFFDSYYGGRVEAFYLGKTNSSKYDINSMYPYIMSTAIFPNPKFLKKSDTNNVQGLLHDMKYFEGQATLEVKHKKVNFGFLPVKHDGKLLFPVGKLKGTWCFPEIRYALEQGIIEITKVSNVYISYRMQSPFKLFSTDLYRRRKLQTGIMNTVLKLLLNSLYGKFAQRQKFKEIYFDMIPFDLMENLRKKKIPFEIKTFNKVRNDCYLHIFEPVEITGKTVIRNTKPFQSKIHTIPLFSSYITSLARVYLLQQMRKYEHAVVTYVDTDCICLEKEIDLPDSSVLGCFKKESEIITEIFGNKNYVEIRGTEINRKIKGVPKKAQALEGTWNIETKTQNFDNSFEFDTFVKTKASIRRNKNAGTIETIKKTITNKYDKRTRTKQGKTKPIIFV